MHLIPPRSGMLALALAASLTAAGCMGPQTATPRPARIDSNYRTRQLNTSDYDAAFAAAQGAILDHFQIASADKATGVIELAPSESNRLGGTRVRRVGQIVIHRTGSFIVAAVQVQIEKYATPGIRAIQPGLGGDDRPGMTPIQQEGGLTPQQQEYWMPQRRDTALETQILNQIVAAVDQASPSGASQPAVEPPTPRQ